jgi:ribonuclease R
MFKDWQIVRGKFIQAASGEYGFLEVEWKNENLFVFWWNKNKALDQDEVEAEVRVFKGKIEAKIIKIIKRADRIWIWEFIQKEWDSYGFVNLFNPAIKNDIFIPLKFLNWAKSNDIVAIKIIDWEGKSPMWKILEVLWDKNNPKTIINWYILEAWFKLEFPKRVLSEVKKLKKDIEKNKKYRKDKTNLFTFTIDGEDSKDLDDALSIQKKENWDYLLYVHIADVAHYLQPGGSIQEEAFKRGTSVYLPHKVLPMLPEKLSNDLCSLNPNTEKLTLTCEMLIDNEWKLKKHTVYESFINSNYRLTYKEVQYMYDNKLKIWDKLMFGGKVTKELLEKINISYELKNKVWKIKVENWLLWFDFPETKIVVDDNLQVVDFTKYPIYDSNQLIEEFMVLANESVSRKFTKYPFLYRIHERPKVEDIEKLEKILKVFGVFFDFVHYNTKEFANLIEKVKLHKDREILEKLILRTLQKAVYSNINIWHFWLWLKFYSHFTSPIRRYPDYQIHRIIKLKLQWKLTWKLIEVYKKKLESIAKKCTEQEIKAQKLEWKVRDYFMIQYYKDKIWQQFEWTVSGMIGWWIFVVLKNTAEWFVELISKDNKNSDWEPDIEIMQFFNKKTKERISIWDKVSVKLKSIDDKKLRIEFELI